MLLCNVLINSAFVCALGRFSNYQLPFINHSVHLLGSGKLECSQEFMFLTDKPSAKQAMETHLASNLLPKDHWLWRKSTSEMRKSSLLLGDKMGRSSHANQTGLKLMILLPQHPKRWDCRLVHHTQLCKISNVPHGMFRTFLLEGPVNRFPGLMLETIALCLKGFSEFLLLSLCFCSTLGFTALWSFYSSHVGVQVIRNFKLRRGERRIVT